MRLLYLIHQYPPSHIGGTELYTRSLAQALARRGHQVTVFHRQQADGIGQKRQTRGGVQVWSAWAGIPSPTRRFLAGFGDRALAHAFEVALREVKPDLVHVQHLMGLPIETVDLIRKSGHPFVITLHDYWWVCANANLLTNYDRQLCGGPQAYVNCARCALARAGHSGWWPALPPVAGLMAWRNRKLRRVLESCYEVIAPSEFVRNWYAAHGVPKEFVSVIAPGLARNPRVSRPDERDSDEVRFAYIGGLSWQKGVHHLVKAFNGLRGNAELWIAGDESFDPAYVERLRALSIPRIRFLGRLSRDEVWDTLAQVDVVTVPSLSFETYSFAVSEAHAARVPVVASRLGALAERVRDGVDGLLVPPGDVTVWREALQRFVDEADLSDQLRVNIPAVKTLDEHVDEIEALYGRVVDESLAARTSRT
jgi:glycosyltransferase involved in cell wall biosynthesis